MDSDMAINVEREIDITLRSRLLMCICFLSVSKKVIIVEAIITRT